MTRFNKSFQEDIEELLTSGVLEVGSDEAGVQKEIETEEAGIPGEDLVVISAEEAGKKTLRHRYRKDYTITRALNFGYHEESRRHLSSMKFRKKMFEYNQP